VRILNLRPFLHINGNPTHPSDADWTVAKILVSAWPLRKRPLPPVSQCLDMSYISVITEMTDYT
jgi:hypothetical protein